MGSRAPHRTKTPARAAAAAASAARSATSGLPDEEQGRATRLATMTQQVGIALGIPVMSAVVTARTGAAHGPEAVLSGVSTAILANSALVLAGAVLAGHFLAGGARRPKDG